MKVGMMTIDQTNKLRLSGFILCAGALVVMLGGVAAAVCEGATGWSLACVGVGGFSFIVGNQTPRWVSSSIWRSYEASWRSAREPHGGHGESHRRSRHRGRYPGDA